MRSKIPDVPGEIDYDNISQDFGTLKLEFQQIMYNIGYRTILSSEPNYFIVYIQTNTSELTSDISNIKLSSIKTPKFNTTTKLIAYLKETNPEYFL